MRSVFTCDHRLRTRPSSFLRSCSGVPSAPLNIALHWLWGIWLSPSMWSAIESRVNVRDMVQHTHTHTRTHTSAAWEVRKSARCRTGGRARNRNAFIKIILGAFVCRMRHELSRASSQQASAFPLHTCCDVWHNHTGVARQAFCWRLSLEGKALSKEAAESSWEIGKQ